MKKIVLFLSVVVWGLSCSSTTSPSCTDDITCSNHGTCVVSGNIVTCDCEPGYKLDGLECISKECKPACIEGESCELIGNDVKCICHTERGYHLEDGVCTKDITDCDPSCDKGEFCKKLDKNLFSCVCNKDAGYELNQDNKCVFLCGENAHVNDSNDGCICDEGYIYKNNEKKECIVKRGCEADEVNCGNGTCKDDLEKDYYCECDDGYFFNGITCVKITCDKKFICGSKCCIGNKICMRGECKILGDSCNEDSDCPVNEFCDVNIGKCLELDKDDDLGCYYRSDFLGELTPLTVWNWPNENSPKSEYKNVIMIPAVVNLDDDNGDDIINLDDTPDIIFSSYASGLDKEVKGYHNAYLRIVNSKTGEDKAIYEDETVDGGVSITVAKIDGKVYFYTLSSDRKKVLAFSYNGSEIIKEWTQDTELYFESGYLNEGMPAVANIDHKGSPELVVGDYIIDAKTGIEKCHSTDPLGSYGNNSDWAIDANAKDDHTNRRYAPVIQDMNGDGYMDIITGNQFISGKDCSRLQAREDRHDGFPAIADIDGDGEPEIVVMSNGKLYIYNKLMNDRLIAPLEVDGEASSWPKYPIGGPPTIANFDDDPELEIAVSGKDHYNVIDINVDNAIGGKWQANIKWKKETRDKSSRETGSSLFDFEGDGKAEVLYSDECYFRIYDGNTGEERFKIKNTSETILEYPIVVDLDNDGKSEILLVSNEPGSTAEHVNYNKCDHKSGTYGLKVFEDTENRWVRTRRIWNQHSYHITNVEEDGTIPKNEELNWRNPNFNNYRLNSQGKGIFNAPDFQITMASVKRIDCPELKFRIKFSILNKGTISVSKGLPISVYKSNLGNNLGFIRTSKILRPGESEVIEFDFIPVPDKIDSFYKLIISADDRGNTHDDYKECHENNNQYSLSFKGKYRLYCQKGIGECMRFSSYQCDENDNLVCNVEEGTPQEELCSDGVDNDCDGEIDEGCSCNAGEVQECYNAPKSFLEASGTSATLRCKAGTQSCVGGETFTECKGDVLPMIEKCNGIDDDCDGKIDNGFSLGESCTVGIGECENTGVYECDSYGNRTCSVKPHDAIFEICNNGLDDNCNGEKDENPCREE